MGKYIFMLVLLVLGKGLQAQEQERAVNLVKPQEFFINSYLNLTGQSSLVLEVDLPPNTVRWFYTVAASRSKESIGHARAQFSLFAQLTRIIDRTGTAAKAIDLLTSPPGSDYCNVYLLASRQDADAFNKEFSIKNYRYNTGCSRENFVAGTVEIADREHLSGKQFLGFYNPSAIYGISMVVEVAAVVLEETRINGWSAREKEKLFNDNRAAFIEKRMLGQLTEQQAAQLYDCVIDKITATYTPPDLNALAAYELEKAVNGFISDCNTVLGFAGPLQPAPKPEDVEPGLPVITAEELTGIWESDHTMFHFFPDGSIRLILDDGKEKFGNWRLTGNRLDIKTSERRYTYQVSELKNRRLICQDELGKRIVYKKNKN